MAFWVFSPFQVPAPALVHIIIFHHFITKLPLKLSKGYFKPSKVGESECTRLMGNKWWSWWCQWSHEIKGFFSFLVFFKNEHYIFTARYSKPACPLPAPCKTATPAREVRQVKSYPWFYPRWEQYILTSFVLCSCKISPEFSGYLDCLENRGTSCVSLHPHHKQSEEHQDLSDLRVCMETQQSH